jgi:hypothetical protein
MQNFDDIKNLWQKTEEKNLPDAAEILLQVQKARKKMLLKTIGGGLILCFTFVFIALLAIHYQFQQWTTRTGIILTLIAIIMGIIFNSKLVQLLLKQSDLTLSNAEYLQQLVRFRTTQRLIQTKGITFYFILLTVGIVLYMYEFAQRDLVFGICAYAITLAWIAFNWFYTRKRTIEKQQKAIDEQIANIERLLKEY